MVSPTGLEFVVPPSTVLAIPAAMTICYVLPTVLMSLPAPSIIGFQQKQSYMAIWQMFPLWVSLAQEVFTYAIRIFIHNDVWKYHGKLPRSSIMGPLRMLYMGLLLIAGIGQIATATLMVTSAFFPDLFSVDFKGVFNASKVFLPAAISPSTKMSSIGSGAHMLLQYDEAVGSLAMMIWSTVLFVSNYRTGRSAQTPGHLAAKGAVAFVLAGPLGYAAACIWARDEMVEADLMTDDLRKGTVNVEKTN